MDNIIFCTSLFPKYAQVVKTVLKGHAHLFVQVPRYSWLLTSEHRISGPSRKLHLGMTSSHTVYLSAYIPGSCKHPSFLKKNKQKTGLLLTKLKTPQNRESCLF